jgi:hypothetical protein
MVQGLKSDEGPQANGTQTSDGSSIEQPAGDAPEAPPGEDSGQGAAPSTTPPSPADTNWLSDAARLVGAIAGQTTLIAALLFYFGWVRIQAELMYFGVNADVANVSVDDYLLASSQVAIRMLVFLGLLAMVALASHRWLKDVLTERRSLVCITMAVGVLLCIGGVLGYFNVVNYSSQYPIVPVMLGAGVTIVWYADYLRGQQNEGAKGKGKKGRSREGRTHEARTQKARTQKGRAQSRSSLLSRAEAVALIAVDVLLIFWVVAVYADNNGTQYSEQLKLRSLPGVVVYSSDPLGLAAPGLSVKKLAPGQSRYSYRYSGLKYLLYSSGQYFLLPDRWKRGHDPVFVLRQDDGMRVEFYSPVSSAPLS